MERFTWHGIGTLKGALDLDTFEALDLVARLDVVVGLDADTALGALADFVDVLLEATQRFQLALEDDGVVAQHADRLGALDHAFDHHAAGDRTELGAAEHVADLGGADNLFADFLAQDARGDLLHLVDHVIDDREVTQVDAVALDHLACRGVGTDVEADDRRLRRRCERGIGLGYATHAAADHVDANSVGGQAGQRIAQGLYGTLHVGLDHEIERLLAGTLAHLGHDVFHAVARLCDQARLAALGVALLCDVLGQALVLDHDEIVAGVGHARQAEHLHGNRRAGAIDLRTGFVE